MESCGLSTYIHETSFTYEIASVPQVIGRKLRTDEMTTDNKGTRGHIQDISTVLLKPFIIISVENEI